jgi:hypothetical protein
MQYSQAVAQSAGFFGDKAFSGTDVVTPNAGYKGYHAYPRFAPGRSAPRHMVRYLNGKNTTGANRFLYASANNMVSC